MNDSKQKGIYILEEPSLEVIYSTSQRAEIEQLIEISAVRQSSESILDRLHLLNDIDVMALV